MKVIFSFFETIESWVWLYLQIIQIQQLHLQDYGL